MDSSRLLQSISLNDEAIMIPTSTSTGAVAAAGTALTKVLKKADRIKQREVITDAKPVRPPAPIPAALSTNVVVFDVPINAPIEVAVASAKSALSKRVLKPFPSPAVSSSSKLNILSCQKYPLC